MRAVSALQAGSQRVSTLALFSSQSFAIFLTFRAELGMRIELQSISFNGFMAGGTNTVGYVRGAAKGLIDLPHLLLIPPSQAVEKAEPILTGQAVHPLGILFDLTAFPLKMLEGCLDAFPPLPKPTGTGDHV